MNILSGSWRQIACIAETIRPLVKGEKSRVTRTHFGGSLANYQDILRFHLKSLDKLINLKKTIENSRNFEYLKVSRRDKGLK